MTQPEMEYSHAWIQMEDGETHLYRFDETCEDLERWIMDKMQREPFNPFIRIDYANRPKNCRAIYLNKSKIKEIGFFEGKAPKLA